MMEVMLDTIFDILKLIPFLFLTFLLMEFLEHNMKSKSKKMVKRAGKMGPLIGGILGAFPQCGFSVAATNLYATRIISIGTLISIYLSTSDEMLPILISEKAPFSFIISIILIKVIIGIIFGFIIDFILKTRKSSQYEIKDFCKDNHCNCNHGILKSAIHHTFNISFFILIISFILNIGFKYLGEDTISKIFMKNNFFGPFISSLIGLIPNCGSSVIITELYLNNTISLGSVISGLLTGSGVAMMVLFRVNKNFKENISIVLSTYLIGSFVGIILDLFNFVI